MMIFSLVAMTGLEKCCIAYAYLQWLCHSGERPVVRGPLVGCFVAIVGTECLLFFRIIIFYVLHVLNIALTGLLRRGLVSSWRSGPH